MRGLARRGRWGFEGALLCGLLVACAEPGATTTTAATAVVDPAAAVAVLAVVEGAVSVRSAAGVEVAATAEMALARTDTVITSPGALVVVVLANGHVLKLEEDQATPVRALAHLDDPPPRESVAELFERALGAEAFARVGGAGRLERIAGWNARRAAGETPAPVVREERPAPPAIEVKAEDAPDDAKPLPGGADADGAGGGEGRAESLKESTRQPTPQAKPSRDSETRPEPAKKLKDEPAKSGQVPTLPPPATAESPAPEASGPAVQAPDLVALWSFETSAGAKVAKPSLPAALASQRAALAQCVAAAQPGVATPVLRLRVAAGAIAEVSLGGGAAAPACAKSLVGQRLPEAGGDGWAVVRVRR